MTEPTYNNKSLFGRLINVNPSMISFTLNEQFRMPSEILQQVDKLFSYGMKGVQSKVCTAFPIIEYAIINGRNTEDIVINIWNVIMKIISNIDNIKTVLIASSDEEKSKIEKAIR